MTAETKPILVDQIEPLIHEIHGRKVVLDSDLAALYDVQTKVLNQAIQRNLDSFPPDFRFQLTESEMDSLRSQIVTSNVGRDGRRYVPYVFTEHGVVIAASVLNSPRAVEVSVFVVRAFVKLRQLVLPYKEFAGKLDQLERKVGSHDEAIKQLVAAVRQLMAPAPASPKNKLAFTRSASQPRGSPSCPNRPLPSSPRNAKDAPLLKRLGSRRRCVVRVLVEMLAPYKGRVYDPCCDSGGSLEKPEQSSFARFGADFQTFIKQNSLRSAKRLQRRLALAN